MEILGVLICIPGVLSALSNPGICANAYINKLLSLKTLLKFVILPIVAPPPIRKYFLYMPLASHQLNRLFNGLVYFPY